MNRNIERTAALHELMAKKGVDAYIILTDDFHASEYVNDYFKCREYISGFNGSAGTLVVTADDACLWTDGRYFIQAAEQLAGGTVRLMKMGEPGVPTLVEYLKDNLADGSTVGYDGRTVNADFADMLEFALQDKNVSFEGNHDLVGDLWENRPAFPAAPVWELSAEYTGMTRGEKLALIRSAVADKGADCFVLSSVDDIAWLFNLRGGDVEHNPVFMSYTVISEEETVLFANVGSFSAELEARLKAEGISLREYPDVYEYVKHIPEGSRVLLDRSKVNVALLNAIPEGCETVFAMNPTTVFKGRKTETEMENIRKAHIQDGVAVTKLHYWLHLMESEPEFLEGRLTELDVAAKLLELRQERPGYLDLSFGSIVATGAHGAINHYSPDEESNAVIEKDNFLLMDTGGQYYEGTTDITRTIAMGELTYEQKRNYTAVLRANLNLAALKFRYGCNGSNLDAVCRAALWELGLDFNHGTGHGVGYLLNVHEGPQRIRVQASGGAEVTFEHGMLTSDEPGVYLEGEYGIRLENLMLCVNDRETSFGKFMRFETVTMVPFDRRAILPEEMNSSEKQLLNEYHAKVYETIAPYLTEDERAWLKEETKAI